MTLKRLRQVRRGQVRDFDHSAIGTSFIALELFGDLGSNPVEGMDVCKCIVPLRHESTLNCANPVVSHTRAFGDGPRNLEPWSSDVDDTLNGTPLLTTTPPQREDVAALDRFNVHHCPTRWVFSGTGFELVTRQATIRYLYHSATAA
ncbi:uncharacterized protein TNCV_998401 [Trichonephila clavipes]|nr:uncharacterized protein TNCV_998401 [Trichonephila clavipes]